MIKRGIISSSVPIPVFPLAHFYSFVALQPLAEQLSTRDSQLPPLDGTHV